MVFEAFLTRALDPWCHAEEVSVLAKLPFKRVPELTVATSFYDLCEI